MARPRAEHFVAGMVALLVVGVVLIYWSLGHTDTPRGKLLAEIAKIMAGGIVVGVLGVWAKQLIEDITRRREEEKTKAEARAAADSERQGRLQELFGSLRKACRKAINDLPNPKHNFASFAYIFQADNSEYEDFLDEWEVLEQQGVVIKARSSFQELQERFNREGLTPQIRKDAENKARAWLKYYAARAVGNDVTGMPVPMPEDWK